MERKIKHRILGILVMIALVIVLLPLFQGEKVIPTETVAIKAPPFPEAVSPAPQPNENTVNPEVASLSPNEQDIEITQNQNNEHETNQQANDVISVTHPSVVNLQAPDKLQLNPAPSVSANTIAMTNVNNDKVIPIIKVQPEQPVKQEVKHLAKTVSKKPAQLATLTRYPQEKTMDNNGLIKLKNAVWVIQIGSFKNKTNALRLVNQLRANGYRAFIQQMWATSQGNTRVYVGPMTKQIAARSLANRIETDMHIHGIVISYQPLVL